MLRPVALACHSQIYTIKNAFWNVDSFFNCNGLRLFIFLKLNLLRGPCNCVHEVYFQVLVDIFSFKLTFRTVVIRACTLSIHLEECLKVFKNILKGPGVLRRFSSSKCKTKRIKAKSASLRLICLLIIRGHSCTVIYASFIII